MIYPENVKDQLKVRMLCRRDGSLLRSTGLSSRGPGLVPSTCTAAHDCLLITRVNRHSVHFSGRRRNQAGVHTLHRHREDRTQVDHVWMSCLLTGKSPVSPDLGTVSQHHTRKSHLSQTAERIDSPL